MAAQWLDDHLTSANQVALPPFVSNTQLWLHACNASSDTHPEIRILGGQPGDLVHVTLASARTRYWDATYTLSAGGVVGERAPATALPHVDFHVPCHLPPHLTLSVYGLKPQQGTCAKLAANQCVFLGAAKKSDVLSSGCANQCVDFLTNCFDARCPPDMCPGCTDGFKAQHWPWFEETRAHYKSMFGDFWRRYLSTPVYQEVYDLATQTSSQQFPAGGQWCTATSSIAKVSETCGSNSVGGDWKTFVQTTGSKAELLLRLKPTRAEPDDIQFQVHVRTKNCPKNLNPAECEDEEPIDREVLKGLLRPTENPQEWAMHHLGVSVRVRQHGDALTYEANTESQQNAPSVQSAEHGIGTFNFRKPPSSNRNWSVFPPLNMKIACTRHENSMKIA